MHVPFYDSLTVAKLMTWAATNYAELAVFFPCFKEQAKLPRQWCINVLYSRIGEPFAAFVKAQMGQRNDALQTQKDLRINIDPAILQAFKSSSLVSSKWFYQNKISPFFHLLIFLFVDDKSAIGANLMKIGSKRKRGRQEIKDEKLKAEQEAMETKAKMDTYAQMERKANENTIAAEWIQSLMDQGIIEIGEDNNPVLRNPNNM